MKKITLKPCKLCFIVYFIGVSQMFGQCPENINLNSTEDQCGAVVSYNVTDGGGGDGGWSENGIINGSGEDGLDGWTLNQNGGSGWAVASGYFVTSYATCSKSQVVDLSDLGLSDEYMDSEPAISISDDYIGWTVNFADTYFLTVELRGEANNVIATYTTGNITTSSELQTASHIFTDYGPGVRKVYFSHGGKDVEFWLGNYGAAMNNSQVRVTLPGEGGVAQTAGLPSGSTFPVGTTTNTFEITDDEGDITTCSFDVIVTDSEGPVVAFNEDLTITLDENGTASLAVEDVNNSSTDNCEIDTYELSKTEFTCEDTGENTIIFTVTDIHGNSSVANVPVIVVDTTAPAATAQNITVQLNEDGLAEITPQQIDNGSADNCEIDTYELSKTEFTCEDAGENTVTFTVTDIHGNVSTANVQVVVVDETAPIAIAQNITIQLNEGGLAEITPQLVDNGSADNCSIALYSLDKDNFTCDDLGDNEVIFTVEDDNGNTHSQTVTVTVEDPEDYCNTAGMIGHQSESIRIYPNPISGSFEISGLTDGYDKIEFYDTVGKLVKVMNGDENDLSALETGIYFAKIFSKDRVLIKEIVKN